MRPQLVLVFDPRPAVLAGRVAELRRAEVHVAACASLADVERVVRVVRPTSALIAEVVPPGVALPLGDRLARLGASVVIATSDPGAARRLGGRVETVSSCALGASRVAERLVSAAT